MKYFESFWKSIIKNKQKEIKYKNSLLKYKIFVKKMVLTDSKYAFIIMIIK